MNKFVIFSFIAVVICVKCVFCVTQEQKALIQSKLLASGLSCIKDYPLSLAEIKAFKNKMLPDGENGKCFAACLFKNVGVMDDMGKLNAANTRKIAEEVFKSGDEHLMKTDKLIQECSSVNDAPTSDGAKGCDRAKLAFNCLSKNADKYGFNIDF